MKKLTLFLFLVLGSWLCVSAQQAGEFAPGIYHVKVSPKLSQSIQNQSGNTGVIRSSSVLQPVQTGVATFDAVSSELKTVEMVRMFPYHPKYEARQRKAGLHLWYVMKVDQGIAVQSAVQRLMSTGDVQLAQPAPMPRPYDNGARSTESPTSDPRLWEQWHYNNTGQRGGTPGADINLFNAWKITMGDPKVVVAIIDGGFDVNHEDLKANLWVNQKELEGEKGLDNDGNGYVNDIYGYNFVLNTGTITAESHGTHVAGTVGAVNNNGKGVAGVAGGDGSGNGVRLMSCQIFNAQGGTPNTAEPFVYAANNGAVIAQNSWGWTSPNVYDQATLDAIDYFIEYAGKDENGNPLPNTPMSGGIVIFAAGNDSQDKLFYPGCYEPVFSVAALNQYNERASYSNYGAWVDIAAPGGDTWDSPLQGVLSTLPNNQYGYMDGTSMACPHVSGVAALVLSKYGSGAYSPDMLKQRMLMSCRDINDINPSLVGRLGAGLIDAEKSLAPNTGEPPVKAAISLLQASRQFIDVTFLAPSDPDNGSAYRYEIRYSDAMITSANFSKLPSIQKSAKLVGERDTIRVVGLKPLTKYYLALRSYDVWGNLSELSNVLEVTTTSSPKVELALTTPINLTIDYSSSATGFSEFAVSNLEDGVLLYTAGSHIAKDPRPIPPLTNKPIGELNISPGAPQWAEYTIGEDGVSGEFHAANRFQVADEEFNLTHVIASLATKNAAGTTDVPPFRIKVVRGGADSPASGTIIYDEEVDYKSWSTYDKEFDLGEQLLFKKGEYLWIIFAFPKEYKMPMGSNYRIKNSTGKSFYTEDGGLTWNSIDAINLYEPQVIFRIFGLSRQYATNQVVNFTPASGTVAKGNPQTVKAEFDVTNMLDGSYEMHLKAFSNDSGNSAAWVPVNLTVTGHKPKFSATPKVDFATVVVGKQARGTVVITNDGLGELTITNITTTAPFTVVDGVTSLTVPPKQKRELEVAFSPVTGENLTAALSMLTNDGGTKKVVLHGAGVEPPVMELDPVSARLSFTGAAGDNIPSQTFKIKNTGKYELTYSMPAAIEANNPELIYKDKYTGYVARMDGDVGAPTIAGWADMAGAIDMTGVIGTGNKCHTVDLGFTMPYYGKEYSNVTLTPMGIVMMGEETAGLPNNANSIPENGGRGKTVAPFWAPSLDIVKVGGQVLYKKFPGKLVVEFRKLGLPEAEYNFWGVIQTIPATGTIDIQLALFNDGRIEFRYKNFVEDPDPAINSPLLDYLRLVGIENEMERDENYTVTNLRDGVEVARVGRFSRGSKETFITPGSTLCIGFYPPIPEFIKSVSPTSGVVVPGDEQVVVVELQVPDRTLEGTYVSNIHIASNDPIAEKAVVEIEAIVQAVSKPVVDVEQLDFANVYKGSNRSLLLRLSNEGGKPFNVSSIVADNPAFTVEALIPGTSCEGFSSLEYRVTFTPLDATQYNATLTITTNADGYQPLEISLSGAGILSGKLQLDGNAPHVYTLNAEGSNTFKDTFISVTNIGEAPLEVAVGGNTWIKPQDMTTFSTSRSDKFGYYWVDNTTDKSLQFDWLMTENASEVQVYRFLPRKYELPFTFTYYGKEYNELVISAHCQVLFPTEDGDYLTIADETKLLPIPSKDETNNIICAMRRLMYPKSSLYIDARVMVESFDDKFVVSWVDMLPGIFTEWSQGTSVNVQIILYKDGRIKMQYKDVEQAQWRHNSQICIENYDGTDGLDIYLAQGNYIKDNLAIMVNPAVKYQIPVGETRKINLRIDAAGLYDGHYPNGEILVTTNAPTYAVESIPVDLTVVGTPHVAINDVDFGLLYVYETAGSVFKSYEQPITIANTGTKKVTIAAPTIPVGFDFAGFTFPLEVLPNTSISGVVKFIPSAAEGEVVKPIEFSYLPEGTANISFAYNTVLPPKVSLVHSVERGQLYAKVLPGAGYKYSPIEVGNIGSSQLSYKFDVEYISADDVPFVPASASQQPTMSVEQAKSLLVPADVVGLSTAAAIPYSNSFVDTIGYGNKKVEFTGGLNAPVRLDIASRFQAGSEGFNLTHVGCWYKSYLEGEELEVRIMSGRDFKTAKQIHSEKLATRKTNGGMLVDELSKSIYFYPGEYFWIVYGQSLGMEFSFGAFMLNDIAMAEDFYMAFMSGDNYWCKSLLDTYGEYAGLVMDAYSSERKEGVESWITLRPLSGTRTSNAGLLDIAANDSYEVDLRSDVLNGDYRDRYAVVHLRSNDPMHNTEALYVTLAFNQAPTIQGNDKLSLREGEEASITITVGDADGENVSLSCTPQDVEPGAVVPTVSVVGTGSDYTLTINAPFGSEGTWSYLLTATDDSGQVTTMTVTVTIAKGDYAPVITIEGGNHHFIKETHTADIVITPTDINGDLVSFGLIADAANEVENAPEVVLSPAVSGYVFTVTAVNGSMGRWVYRFEAIDAAGLRTEAELVVTVEAATRELTLFPNPATTHVNVGSQLSQLSTVEIRIYNSVGELAYRQQFDGVRIFEERIDISNLPSGMYILQYLVNGRKEDTKRFVK